MPRLDLDDADGDASSVNPAATSASLRRQITWTVYDRQRTVVLLPSAVVTAGRLSSNDICLRIEPFSDPENFERSRMISSQHFLLRYLGSAVHVTDLGSTNGTFVDDCRLEPHAPWQLGPSTKLGIAEVLELAFEVISRSNRREGGNGVLQAAATHTSDSTWLQQNLVGDDKPGKIDFVRLTRKTNLTSHQYVLLFHSGRVGSDETCLLSIPMSEATPTTGRAFDLDHSPASDPARLLVRNGAIWVERSGGEEVRIDSQPLEPGQVKALPENCELYVGQARFVVTAEASP